MKNLHIIAITATIFLAGCGQEEIPSDFTVNAELRSVRVEAKRVAGIEYVRLVGPINTICYALGGDQPETPNFIGIGDYDALRLTPYTAAEIVECN